MFYGCGWRNQSFLKKTIETRLLRAVSRQRLNTIHNNSEREERRVAASPKLERDGNKVFFHSSPIRKSAFWRDGVNMIRCWCLALAFDAQFEETCCRGVVGGWVEKYAFALSMSRPLSTQYCVWMNWLIFLNLYYMKSLYFA